MNMKYVRTKDGRIIDLQKFINGEKKNPYYKNLRFSKIKSNGILNFSAVGTDKNSINEQVGKRCYFQVTLNSDVIAQANTIEELIECYVVIFEHQDRPLIVFKSEIEHYKHCFVNKVKSNNRVLAIYGSFWVGTDLLSKAKMNDKGKLKLL